MAIDVTATTAASRAAIKTAMAAAYGEAESVYDEFAGILADNVVKVVLDEIKDNADVTGVTSGSDTVAGGVD